MGAGVPVLPWRLLTEFAAAQLNACGVAQSRSMMYMHVSNSRSLQSCLTDTLACFLMHRCCLTLFPDAQVLPHVTSKRLGVSASWTCRIKD